MGLRNNSFSLGSGHDFNCCCSVSRTHFDTDGSDAVQIINLILTIPTSLTATVGNLLVMLSIWRTPSLHSQSNSLIFGLALSDVVVGLVAQPVFLVLTTAKIKRLADVFCNSAVAFAVISRCLCSFSFLILTIISLDRYTALHLHLRYQELVTLNRVFAAIISTCIVSLLFGLSALWTSTFVDYVSIVLIFIGFSTTNFAYFKINQIVSRHRRQIRQNQAQFHQDGQSLNIGQYKKTFVNMLLIYCFFLFCYTPYLVVTIVIVVKGLTISTASALEAAMVIMCMNSTFNPLVYCWRFKPLRTAVTKTVRDVLQTENSTQTTAT